MKIKRLSDRVFSFDKLLKNTLDTEMEITNAKEPKFRLSSSPFCIYSYLQDYDEYISNKMCGNWGLVSDFFTGIGTVVHSALQKWIPVVNPGYVLGNYRCLKCCKHPESEECVHCTNNCEVYLSTVVGPKYCKKCSKEMQYEEFHFIIPPAISGHCDGIMLYGDKVEKIINSMGIDKYNTHLVDELLRSSRTKVPLDAYVLEFKTSTKSRVCNITAPLIHHEAQATMYGTCAQNHMDSNGVHVNIVGSLVKYIARDVPYMSSGDLKFDRNDRYYKYNVLVVKRLYKAIVHDDLRYLKMEKPCKGEFCRYYLGCKYATVCKDPEFMSNITNMFERNKSYIRNSFIQFKKEFGKGK